MNRNKLFTVVCAAAVVTACSSGDINIEPTTSVGDTTINNPGGGSATVNDCASIVVGGQTVQGSLDSNDNCVYGSSFVGPKNNLQDDLYISALPNGRAHVFTSSLFVGNPYQTSAELAAAGIAEGGDGPTLTIEAGATLAFETNKDFIIINRGSRILADGRADAPITFTSVSDINGTVLPEDVQQWGGIVINGFAVTSKCSYTPGESRYLNDDPAEPNPNFSVVGDCAIDAEGSEGDDESWYGGDNDNDDSGILRYVVVKHTGAAVGNGDELNGISFGAVGRNTIIENLEVYSMFDDGIEMFGGSVNVTNYVAVYVRDDSIDIDEGYNGTIRNALVLQQEMDGDHCIEADGLGSYGDLAAAVRDDLVARGLNSRPTIENLTCIVSANNNGSREDGLGQGFRLREGLWPTINNALLISSYGAPGDPAANNYCLRISDSHTHDGALSGEMSFNGFIAACQDISNPTAIGAFADEQAWAESNGAQFATIAQDAAQNPTAASDTGLQLLGGSPPIYSLTWATSMVDGAAPLAGSAPVSGDYLGAVVESNDWTQGWTYGIHDGSRAQALWFE